MNSAHVSRVAELAIGEQQPLLLLPAWQCLVNQKTLFQTLYTHVSRIAELAVGEQQLPFPRLPVRRAGHLP